MVDLQGVGQRGHNDVVDRLPGLTGACLEGPHKCFRDLACQCRHDRSAPIVQTGCPLSNTVNEMAAILGPDRRDLAGKRGISTVPHRGAALSRFLALGRNGTSADWD